jgi:hypothetical protein
MAFRSSLEVTPDPRVGGISQKLLPWLIDLGCDHEIDPIEREEFATPLGQLSKSQRMDLRWAGEAAAVFCWMLRIGPPLHETTPANFTLLPTFNCILKPAAADIINAASLRDQNEIECYCRQRAWLLALLRESRVRPPASDILRRIHIQKLNSLNLPVTDDDARQASDTIARMTPQDRTKAAGLYFIRNQAATWFFSDRPTYFTHPAPPVP